jgi:hypothetical protein
MKTAAAIFMPYVCTVVGSSGVYMKTASRFSAVLPVIEDLMRVLYETRFLVFHVRMPAPSLWFIRGQCENCFEVFSRCRLLVSLRESCTFFRDLRAEMRTLFYGLSHKDTTCIHKACKVLQHRDLPDHHRVQCLEARKKAWLVYLQP